MNLNLYKKRLFLIVLVPTFITGLVLSFTGDFYKPFGSQFVYAISNWITIFILYKLVNNKNDLKNVFIFKKINTNELFLSLICLLVGIFVIFPISEYVSSYIGFGKMSGLDYQIRNFFDFCIVFFYAVITAPIVEEILFRGFLIRLLTIRGFSSLVSAIISSILFTIIHVPYFGLSGALFILLWSSLPIYLRLKYNNLSPGLLMHILNNFYAYIILIFINQ